MRTFLYVLIFVLLIPIALVLAISLLLANPDLYRDRLTDTFKAETGLELKIKGDIGWRYWPLIALSVNDLEVSPPGAAPLAQLQSAAIDLKLLPLLFGSDNIAIDGIFIEGLNINLEIDENGKGNWETTTAAETTPEQPATGREDEAPGRFTLSIAGIGINDAKIEYQDRSADQHYRIELTSLKTGPVSYDEPFNIEANFFIEDKVAAITSRTDASAQLSFKRDLDHVTVIQMEKIFARLDSSLLKGNLTLTLKEKTGVEFDFHLDRLNVSDYLPPEPAGEGEATVSDSGAMDVEVIPADMLNAYVIAGRLEIEDFSYDTYHFAPLKVVLDNKQQRLTADVTAQAYEGNFRMTFSADTGTQTSGRLQVAIADLNVTQLTEWEWITGTLNADSNTQFKGRMLSEILDSIDGPSSFTITDGTLDVTPIKTLAGNIDALRGRTSSVSQWPDMMPFEHLEGSHALKSGIARDQSFSFQVENLKVAGTGGVDYWQNRLEYDIEVSLNETESGQFQVNPRLAGIGWPLRCAGKLDDSPVDMCSPNSQGVQRLVADMARQELQRRGEEKVQEKIGDKLPEDVREGAKKLLKGIFDR